MGAIFVAGSGARLRLVCRMMTSLMLIAPLVTHAALRCIENESQIQATLNAALASADSSEEVRIKSGFYNFTTGANGYFGVLQGVGKTLSIRGGWSGAAGSCTTQDGASTSTVFSGNNQRPIFAINASTTFTGSVIIENMLFVGGLTSAGSTASALSLAQQNGGVMSILVDRVWIEGNNTQAGVSASTLQLTSDSVVVFRNSVVVNNNSGTAPPINISVRAGQNNLVLNNTIADNTTAQSSGYAGLFVTPSNGATLLLANNLMDRNTATAFTRADIRVNGSGTTLQNNRYTGLSGVPTAESGSTSGSAGFNGSSYDLSDASTARDAGAFFVPLLQGFLDALSEARVQGSAVDLGALEYSSRIFRNGFD